MLSKFFARLDKYLLLIVIIAAVLRSTYLNFVPPSLNWDEVSHGYNAYSILITGKDEWGVKLPTIFRAYGDYKLPVYIYLSAASEKFFGLTDFALRLPAALAGIGTVIFSYLLAFELLKKRNLARLTAFLVAVEPWSLFLSRGAFEANLALFFIVSGVYFFLKSVQSTKYLVLSTLFLGLSVWTYNSARVFVPVLILILLFIYWGGIVTITSKHKTILVLSVSVLAIFFIPMFVQLFQPIGQARYGKVSIIDSGAIARIIEARNTSKLSPVLNRTVNNRPVYFVTTFIKNWASHFSGNFLFFEGGRDYQFSVPGRGIVYWINIVPIIVGLFWLVLRRSKSNSLILAWLLLSPIPSALTNEAPQVLRSITMLPIPMIICAIGVIQIVDWFEKKLKVSADIIIAIYLIVVFIFLGNYLVNYFTNYRMNYSWSWQYGYKEAVNYAKEHYAGYDKIIVTKKYGEPHEFFLFYWPWRPEKYNSDPNLIRYLQSDWFWVDRFDKFYFVNDWQIPKLESETWKLESGPNFNCIKDKCLLITSPGNYPKGWKMIMAINFLDGKPAFEILDNSK